MSSILRNMQRMSYLASRDIGDVRAAQRGAKPLASRLVRRQFTRRVTGPLTTALFRQVFK